MVFLARIAWFLGFLSQFFVFIEFPGNTRVVGQQELGVFRDELEKHMSNRYNVILKQKTLPTSLFVEQKKV